MSGLGLGRFPIMPGTVGTLCGIPLAWALAEYLGPLGSALVLVVLWLVGVPLCTRAAAAAGKHDPGWIVWDEIVTLPWVVWGLGSVSPTVLGVAFVLHRVFDITKPPPARQLERLPAGWGIMADDVAAAFYAALTLRLLIYAGWLG